ncbi:MAG: hypothetical protein ACRCVN_03555 [Spirochaetia bacterium]
MKKLVFLMFLFAILLIGCDKDEYEIRRMLSPFAREKPATDTLAERAQNIEDDKSIEQLKRDIERQSKVLNTALVASQNLGQTHYLLGMKYMDYQMYGKAFEMFEEALAFYPEKTDLLYNTGIAAGWMGQSQPVGKKGQEYLQKSRFYLEKSLKSSPNYGPAILSLAILYSNSFDLPHAAKKLMQRYNEVDRPTSTSLFVEARIAVQTLDDRRAIELYSDLAQTAPSEEERQIAKENLAQLTRI